MRVRKSTDERVDTLIQQQNRRTNRLFAAAQLTAAVLCPRCFEAWRHPGSRRAGRGFVPPCSSSAYSHHRGNCGIHGSSVKAMDTRAAVVCAGVRCGQSPVCFSDALNCSSYPLRLFAQETEYKISTWSHFTPSRYLTRTYHVWRKYGDI